MDPQRVTFWCRFWAGSIIGSYFFENKACQAITFTDAQQRDMKPKFCLPKLNDIDVVNGWLQQNILITA